MWTAEIRIRGDDDLAARLADMRVWLDQHRFDASTFTYFHLVPGAKVRVSFKIEDEAAAFAGEFGGTLVHRTAERFQLLSAEAPPIRDGGREGRISIH